MVNDETRRKLRETGWGAAIQALETQESDMRCASMPFDDRLQMLADCVFQEKLNARVERLIKAAGFRYAYADESTIHYEERKLDRNKILELAHGLYIKKNANVILQGFTGSGKSFIACALGKAACKQGISARYTRIPDMLALRSEAALSKGGAQKLLRKYESFGALILDEWLMDMMDGDETRFVLEMVERRHDLAPTIFAPSIAKTTGTRASAAASTLTPSWIG
jgi:DNA replication protein DnaC